MYILNLGAAGCDATRANDSHERRRSSIIEGRQRESPRRRPRARPGAAHEQPSKEQDRNISYPSTGKQDIEGA